VPIVATCKSGIYSPQDQPHQVVGHCKPDELPGNYFSIVLNRKVAISSVHNLKASVGCDEGAQENEGFQGQIIWNNRSDIERPNKSNEGKQVCDLSLGYKEGCLRYCCEDEW